MSTSAKYPPSTIALAILAGTGVLGLALTISPTLVAVPDTPATRAPAAVSLPDLEPAAFDRYAVIAQRPLFASDRRTETIAATTPNGGKASESGYRLAGIIISKDIRLALIERLGSRQVATVRPGDDLDGRHVEDITPDGVALRDAQGITTLSVPKLKGGGWRYAGEQPRKP